MKKTSLKEMLNESTGTEFLKSKEDIKAWLEKYEVKRYEIHDDLTVSLNSDLDLYDIGIQAIPIKFRKTKSIDAGGNHLTYIDWAPEFVDGYFDIRSNRIKSLEGGPKEVTGDYIGGFNQLTTLKGIAETINGGLFVNNNNIDSIEFLPKIVSKSICLDYNKIASFRGIYKVLKQINTNNSQDSGIIYFLGNPVEKGLISLMGIKGIRELDASADENVELKKAVDIINNSIKNNIDALTTQKLLADAGLMKYS